jgi:hypothetical protein
MATLPPCGLYRTGLALGDEVPAGCLVYFHNHGDPGPGVYLPSGWSANRARWHEHGHTIPSPEWAATLEALPAEGLYRVREEFACCERRCRVYEPDLLVQLGYDGEAQPILFVPEWTQAGLAIPETGTGIDADRLDRLAPLLVVEAEDVPEQLQ